MSCQVLRQLYELGNVEMRSTIQSFIESIKVISSHVQDLSLVRQAYLEISLLCLNALSKFDAQLLSERADEVSLGEPVKDRSLNVSVRPSKTVATTSTGKHSKQQQQQKSLKKEKEEKLKTKERQRLRKAAWLAIRTAGAIAKAQKRLGLLTGDPSITSHMIIEKAAQRIPQYSLYDLLGTDEMIQNDENESMVDPTGLVIIPSAQQRQEEFQLSWVHMVKYAAHLKRQLTYGTMGLGSPQTFLVRAALQSEKQALKLEGIHRYLREHLIVYDKECCPILPKDSLLDLASSSTQLPAAGNVSGDKEEHDSKRIEKTSVTLDVLELDDQGTLSPSYSKESLDLPSRQASPDKTGDRSDRIHVRNPVQAGENEIAIQWYQPEFGKEAITTILLCALNNKGVSINDKTATFASYTTVNQLQTSDLSLNGKALKEIHDDLITLVQDAEAYLPPLQGQLSRTVATATFQAVSAVTHGQQTSPTRKKRTMGIKSLSARVDKDDHIKAQLKECLLRIHQGFLKEEEIQEPPFETTLYNVTCLENFFNPTYGHIARTTDTFYSWLSELLTV